MRALRKAVAEAIPVRDFAGAGAAGPSGGADAAGPRVYLQGQLHANETTGSLVLHHLVERYRRRPPPLPLRIVPVANPLGWATYAESGEGRLSQPGGLDWNRIFDLPAPVLPASSSAPPAAPSALPAALSAGSAEEVLRDRLWELSRDHDVVIDVHTPEFGWPHVYASSPARSLATFADLPHAIFGAPVAPTFDEANLRAGLASGRPVTAVTLELPSHGVPTSQLIVRWAARLHAELVHLATHGPTGGAPRTCGEMVDLHSDLEGIAYAIARPARLCRKGRAVVGVVARDGTRVELAAPADCIPLCYRRRTHVKAGSWAVRVIALG